MPNPPPPPPRSFPPPPNGGMAETGRKVESSSGRIQRPQRIVLYGPGGVGKTELCSLLPQVGITPVFADLEKGTHELDVQRYEPETWSELLDTTRNHDTVSKGMAYIVDTLTAAETWAKTWTLANVKTEKDRQVKSIEGYGYGKGYTHVFETFMQLLSELYQVISRGSHVICIVHDCIAKAPNPSGEDWIRYEPDLQDGRTSIRHRLRNWCDHLLYVGFDTLVKDGKSDGSVRTVYPVEDATHWAKSRRLAEPIVYNQGDAEIWKQLFKGAKT